MGVLLTLIAGLVVWIVLWAIGAKSFDAFMITGLMLVLAAAGHLLAPYLPGRRGRSRAHRGGRHDAAICRACCHSVAQVERACVDCRPKSIP
jgi:hypothetical protein